MCIDVGVTNQRGGTGDNTGREGKLEGEICSREEMCRGKYYTEEVNGVWGKREGVQ